MIAERTSTVTVQGNLGGDQYRAGIDEENMTHIINLFTDLYSDQEMAVIREYSTNARDAQIEAGIDAPIQVTLPNALSPFFKVKDVGVGLTHDDIRTVYSRYGTSTKRATNDQNGMLGLGCKSALTYAEQFTVVSVKDGVRTTCSISRGDDGVPVFTVVDTSATTEANGTEVIVPVRRYNEFERKAAKLFKHWPEGSVLVNGEQPKRQDGLKLTDDIILIKREGYSDRTPNEVVMGGVAYPVEADRFATGLPDGYRVIAYVPIGAVSFTPSREALMYTAQTKATLTALTGQVQKAATAAVQREIDAATTPGGAIRTMLKFKDLLPKDAVVNYKGKDMPQKVDGYFTLTSKSARKLGSYETTHHGLAMAYAQATLFVTGYGIQFTANHKRKLLQYCEDKGITQEIERFALTPADSIDNEWIDASRVVTWDTIKAVVLPRTASSSYGWRSGRPTGSYDAYIGGQSQHIQADEIDQDEKIVYFRSMNSGQAYRFAEVIGKSFPNATCVCVPENRYAKFMRFFPEAIGYRSALQEAYNTWLAGLKPSVKMGMAIQETVDTDWLDKFNPARLSDPDLRRAIHVYRNTKAAVADARKARRTFEMVANAVNLTEGIQVTDPLDKYKLLGHFYGSYRMRDGHSAMEHLYLYMNAAYAAHAA